MTTDPLNDGGKPTWDRDGSGPVERTAKFVAIIVLGAVSAPLFLFGGCCVYLRFFWDGHIPISLAEPYASGLPKSRDDLLEIAKNLRYHYARHGRAPATTSFRVRKSGEAAPRAAPRYARVADDAKVCVDKRGRPLLDPITGLPYSVWFGDEFFIVAAPGFDGDIDLDPSQFPSDATLEELREKVEALSKDPLLWDERDGDQLVLSRWRGSENVFATKFTPEI